MSKTRGGGERWAAPARSSGFSPGAAEALFAGLPAAFQETCQAGVMLRFDDGPWRQIVYAYPTRPPARLELGILPEPMRHELIWWLWSLFAGGERVNSWILRNWVQVASASAPRLSIQSFTHLSIGEWMAAAKRLYHDRHHRLPPPSFEQNQPATIARLHAALSRSYSPSEWWRAECWDPRRDARIPIREHEALGSQRLNFTGVPQEWLREAMKWYFAVGLETGILVWSSLPGTRTCLGTHFSQFLSAAGIDTPPLIDHPDTELRGVALAFLSHLRQRRSRSGQLLSLTTVGVSQSALSSFYAFMADHRHEAAKVLGEARWLLLTDAHARFWRAGDVAKRGRGGDTGNYVDPAALSRIVSHVDILALPKDQTKIVVVDGSPREIGGLADPQAMRAFLLAVFTGRRINEILLMDFEPLLPLPGLDGAQAKKQEAFVARLRYRQTKIRGAPNTILVEQEVVNLIAEQQRWLLEHLAQTTRSAAQPRYLFVAWQSNRTGSRPYSANTLRTLLSKLAKELEVRDAQGRQVDFNRTHRFRHTKATELLNAGVPLHVVQRYLGHLSPEMTMWYAATLAKRARE